ncbi:hypothetical protein ACFO3A_12605 [Comamonas nitrativorans]|uniref:Uncharacterized protein n=1 Tax=Comamonas nitrativorans TaxID=108437 RepID=A0ABV9GY15_9BURK
MNWRLETCTMVLPLYENDKADMPDSRKPNPAVQLLQNRSSLRWQTAVAGMKIFQKPYMESVKRSFNYSD